MALDRRTFVGGAGAATLLATSGCLFVALPAHAEAGGRPLRLDPASVEKTAAPEALEAEFRALLRWMRDTGWTARLAAACGLHLDPDDAALDTELFRPLPQTPFGGFGGVRAIEAGDPAMSLLYHVLASPGLTLRGAAGAAPACAYPSIEQLDLLENYIYARQPLPDLGDAVLAIFAYQYRPAHKTPHRKHSDLVYSRTGVARTGNAPSRYDPLMRSYDNAPANPERHAVAVTPARYGLFWARPVRNLKPTLTGEASDRRRTFLMPLRKVYSGCPSIGAATLRFFESHRDEKLARLVAAQMVLPPALGLDPKKPPFLRHSRSSAGAGGGEQLPGHDSNLVSLEPKGSSVLVVPATTDLVRPACQERKRARFQVPPGITGLRANRRYTSLKLEKDGRLQLIDFALSDFLFARGPRVTGYRAPKTAPAFVNIRYRMDAATDAEPTHLGPETPGLLAITDSGAYYAGLFVDGLCDGCVTAALEGPGGAGGSTGARFAMPAFSLVAAPDFFPKVDPLDLDAFDEMFFEGGPEDASGARRRANPNIPHPVDPYQAFPPEPVGLESQVADTITAVFSAEGRGDAPQGRRIRTSGINTLPDTTSRVFAPGWDMTYSRDREGPVYFATFGLGSPFPEDIKLCAAANGMWPGVSPDAARTFHPSLKPLPGLGGLRRRPQTAVPMLDDELGYHPGSPAVTDHRRDPEHGWDGEHGPYFEVVERADGRRLRVNYADVGRADYVQNVLDRRIDFTKVRRLSSEDLIARIRVLQRCIRGLPRSRAPRFTGLWLVSAEQVADWGEGARGLGIPHRLFDDSSWAREIPAAERLRGPGWLFLFARTREAKGNAVRARASVACTSMYVCQIADSRIRWCRISGSATRPPRASDWAWAA